MSKKLINLNAKKIMSIEKIIDLNTKMSIKKIIIALILKINSSNISSKNSFDKSRYNSFSLYYYIKKLKSSILE